MDTNISDYTKRARRYWWIDGLVEMGFGTQLWLLTVYYFITRLFTSLGWGIFSAFISVVLILAGFLAVNKMVSYFKARITYPRTGYIRYANNRKNSRRQRVLVAGGLGIVTSILVNLVLVYFGPVAQWSVIALILLSVSIYLAYYTGVQRYYLMGLLTFIWGVGMNWLPIQEDALYPWFFGGIGTLYILSGLIVFLRYLQRYPLLEGEEDAG